MMAASRTRPGNPDRGWNDPPMFNFAPQSPAGAPRRLLNQRVAYPVTGTAQPGHAVLAPSQGPPCLNPVLAGTGSIQGPPPPPPIPVPIGLRDTPLGNQATPISPVQLLPPATDTTTPQTVPILVPTLVPVHGGTGASGKQADSQCNVQQEQLNELLSRLQLSDDTQLIETNMKMFDAVLEKYRHILTMKVCEEIKKKLDLCQDRWKKGSLSDTVKVLVSQLAEALLAEETDKANHLHLALMVDHISEVNQWMIGVKRLLQQQQLAVKEKELLSASQKEVSDSPELNSDTTGQTSTTAPVSGTQTGSSESVTETLQQEDSESQTGTLQSGETDILQQEGTESHRDALQSGEKAGDMDKKTVETGNNAVVANSGNTQ